MIVSGFLVLALALSFYLSLPLSFSPLPPSALRTPGLAINHIKNSATGR